MNAEKVLYYIAMQKSALGKAAAQPRDDHCSNRPVC